MGGIRVNPLGQQIIPPKTAEPFLDSFVFVGGGHDFEFPVEVIQAWARPVIPKVFIKSQISIPGNAAEDKALLGFRAIRQRLGLEQFVYPAPPIFVGQDQRNHYFMVHNPQTYGNAGSFSFLKVTFILNIPLFSTFLLSLPAGSHETPHGHCGGLLRDRIVAGARFPAVVGLAIRGSLCLGAFGPALGAGSLLPALAFAGPDRVGQPGLAHQRARSL